MPFAYKIARFNEYVSKASLSIDPSWEGEIRCRKKSLMGAIKVDGFKNLAHGYAGDFTVTFQPTPAEASFILEAQKIGEDWFWFHQLTIKVNGGDYCQEVEAKRLNLPTDVYSTDPKERVRKLKAQHESDRSERREGADKIGTLSEVLGMAEELMRIHKLPNRIPPEYIEEWKQRLEAALRHCYGERWAAKFYPFDYKGKTMEGPKDTYPQERWFSDFVSRLKEVINEIHQEQ